MDVIKEFDEDINDRVEFGDIVEIKEQLYLVGIHPYEVEKYYLSNLHGTTVWTSLPLTQDELRADINAAKGAIYSKKRYKIALKRK